MITISCLIFCEIELHLLQTSENLRDFRNEYVHEWILTEIRTTQ